MENARDFALPSSRSGAWNSQASISAPSFNLVALDRNRTRWFAIFSQEIANARNGLRSFLRRSQTRATVCDLLSGDRKCTRWFAIFCQEIANARDGLQSSARRSQMRAMVCDLLSGDRKCTRRLAIFSRRSKSIPFIFKKILWSHRYRQLRSF